jgi:hypothetical protein
MRATVSLEHEVPRPLSSPNSPGNLWPQPSSALKSSFPGGLLEKALGPRSLPASLAPGWNGWD